MRMKHPSIVGLAEKYGKQPAHIFLRWSIQKVINDLTSFITVA